MEDAYTLGQQEGRKTGPRANSKQARMIELMKREEGATIEQIKEETGWNANTIRGAISGALRKRLGLNVITERVTGSGTQARSGYSVYRIPNEPEAQTSAA
ncbi:MAG: DUF3489 domain-containing protein [Magnetococcales bacterium]|nr:DUF3489 domain-containing protein [Magnetococcales bacterium]